MPSLTGTPSAAGAGLEAGAAVGDFVGLMKVRVMSLVVFTAFVGMLLAPGALHPVLAAVALVAIAVGAGASGVLNMWYDADIDAKMRRTSGRPIPAGRVDRDVALGFGIILSGGSVLVLGVAVNWLAAALLAATIAFYAVVYSMWLKRRTAQNIVIGGAAGALPPVIGWAAVTGGIALEPLVLFLVIFMWTPPHFWALALLKEEDYRRAGVPMMPVVAGAASTRRQILVYAALLFPVGLLPWALGDAGAIYAVAAAVLGGLFVWRAARLVRIGDGEGARPAAGKLFGFSILHLFGLFGALIVDHVARATGAL